MDPDLDPDPTLDPTLDPTPFFIDFKDAKKLFFSYNLPIGTLSSGLEKFTAQHIYEKKEGSGAGSGAGSVHLTNGS
jgi:hypothetical protein